VNIALAHFRVGEIDGVSLEMEKWRTVLEELGQRVLFLSGTPDYGEIYLPGLNFMNATNLRQVKNAYEGLVDYRSESEFREDLARTATEIELSLEQQLREQKIDILVPNNIWSLGWNLAAAAAVYQAVTKLGIRCIAHHHDFYWERERYSKPTCPTVAAMLDAYFPPAAGLITHVVINEPARIELQKRKKVEAVVMPNVFDFNRPLWEIDAYNIDLKRKLGIDEADLVLLQATRVTERKAIEAAISLVGELNRRREELTGPLYDGRIFRRDSRIILLMPGLIEAEEEYLIFLKQLARGLGVEVRWAGSLFRSQRETAPNVKYYSLWDAYAIADAVTYPSILEGWGNQFLEGVFARKPQVIYEYPVYESDIKPKGFKAISLGNRYEKDERGYVKIPKAKLKDAAVELIGILKNGSRYHEITRHNFNLGEAYFSYRVLKQILGSIIDNHRQIRMPEHRGYLKMKIE
jgi:hypothetical protein